MPIKKLFWFLIFTGFLSHFSFAQDHKLQTLEQLYQQGHYKLVYRKAGRLLMNPAYDSSKEPLKYRQLAGQELAKNSRWAKRHALEIEWAYRPENPANTTEQAAQQTNAQVQLLVKNAKAQLGVPYKWAGTDPSGFDCSGFTSYVFGQAAIALPRRAVEQFAFCKPIAATEACAGDLIFFSNGGEVNHVGLLISAKGAPKQMIHASSTVGISIVDIDASSYWSARIVGYGRVPKN